MPLSSYSKRCNECGGEARQAMIRLRAYALWEAAGQPLGQRDMGESWQDYFWRRAELQLRATEDLNDALLGQAL